MFDFSASLLQPAQLRKLAILAAILLLTALPALAADIYVDDECTLTQAINAAQGGSNGEGVTCEAGATGAGQAGHDTIHLPSSGPTIAYATSYPDITTYITIEGNNSVLDGENATYFFDVIGGAEFILKNVTLHDGSEENGGAAIYSTARLFLQGLPSRRAKATTTEELGRSPAPAISISGRATFMTMTGTIKTQTSRQRSIIRTAIC